MAYCTVDNINESAVHLDIDSTSEPTALEVADMISQVDTYIDQNLQAAGIDVPITDASLLSVVKPLSINGVLARIYRAIEMDPEREARHQELFDRELRRLMDTPAILATGTRSVSSPSGSDRGTPPFERGASNW